MLVTAIIFAALLSCLAAKYALRNREALLERLDVWLRHREFRKRWRQSSIDAASLNKSTAQLRQAPVASVYFRRSHQDARRAAMDSARHSILSRSYFENRKADGEQDECEDEKHDS